MLKKSSWIDLLDEKIIPYIDAPDYETRYPVLSPLYISKSRKRKNTVHCTRGVRRYGKACRRRTQQRQCNADRHY